MRSKQRLTGIQTNTFANSFADRYDVQHCWETQPNDKQIVRFENLKLEHCSDNIGLFQGYYYCGFDVNRKLPKKCLPENEFHVRVAMNNKYARIK